MMIWMGLLRHTLMAEIIYEVSFPTRLDYDWQQLLFGWNADGCTKNSFFESHTQKVYNPVGEIILPNNTNECMIIN